MGPNWADATMAFASIGTLIVTIVGLYAVYIQISKLNSTLWGDTNGRLCEQALELIKFLSDRPETYDYFYAGKVLEEESPHRVFILYASEAMTNFMEHIALQEKNMSQEQWLTWRQYVITTYNSCPMVRQFLEDHKDWYSNRLHMIVEGHRNNHPREGYQTHRAGRRHRQK